MITIGRRDRRQRRSPASVPPDRGRHPIAGAALLVLVLSVVSSAVAQGAPGEAPLVRIPGAVATVSEGAIVIRADGREITYVPGFGWLADLDVPPPTVVDGEVYGVPELLAFLELDLPVLENVRFAGEGEIRVVLDVPGLDAAVLGPLGAQGAVGAGDALRLRLPSLLIPVGLPDVYGGLEVVVRQEPDGTTVEVSGGGYTYRVFALAEPTRLVIDVVTEGAPRAGPAPALVFADTRESLADGVTYRRFRAEGSGGPTWVHLLEVAPDAGEWRVVGATGVASPMPRLASGAFAAINAGYFNTATREAIGYLVVDGGVLSLPSRNRASVAFGSGAPVIDRVRVDYTVRVNGTVAALSGSPGGEGLGVVTTSGWAGTSRQGVITVDADGAVLDNRVGPVRVPSNAIAVVYSGDNRPLALADEGDVVHYDYRVTPSAFAHPRYAVEAGPLLLKDGLPALRPDLEAFAEGQRILDGLTQQAALGVRPDGTVLLVAAESMIAIDLVDLFLRLGASDALRLDSGGSTTLMAAGRVLNRRSERDVVSAIVWRPSRP
ncbi:MAG: phosphodiester glycosidase family protein [Trueperaceae bacterium]|nr:phosphodiester glycosidase family protein [Trueperaceae bacterium]